MTYKWTKSNWFLPFLSLYQWRKTLRSPAAVDQNPVRRSLADRLACQIGGPSIRPTVKRGLFTCKLRYWYLRHKDIFKYKIYIKEWLFNKLFSQKFSFEVLLYFAKVITKSLTTPKIQYLTKQFRKWSKYSAREIRRQRHWVGHLAETHISQPILWAGIEYTAQKNSDDIGGELISWTNWSRSLHCTTLNVQRCRPNSSPSATMNWPKK